MFELGKFSLIITTRCNLKCKLCCEYIPQTQPFPDMTVEEADRILKEAFTVIDHVGILHLTGGGEPFLHPALPALIESSMAYAGQFDKLMLFTNSTIIPGQELTDAITRHQRQIVVQASRYGVNPAREEQVLAALAATGAKLKVEKYYGDDQSFGGWVDFGEWAPHKRNVEELAHIFKNCAVTRDMHGNWRTRDGTVHWCSRSMRGRELKLLPDYPEDYVDLLDATHSTEQKREKFREIAMARYLSACDYCSGDQGTSDETKRFRAAEQIVN